MLKQMRQDANQSSALFQGFLHAITASDNLTIKTLACILLKKFFLDDRAEEKECPQLTADDLNSLKAAMEQSINMKDDPMPLLRRKAEIVCKIHKKENAYAELITKLQCLASQPISSDEVVVKSKEFAMYMFELLAEYHLP